MGLLYLYFFMFMVFKIIIDVVYFFYFWIMILIWYGSDVIYLSGFYEVLVCNFVVCKGFENWKMYILFK